VRIIEIQQRLGGNAEPLAKRSSLLQFFACGRKTRVQIEAVIIWIIVICLYVVFEPLKHLVDASALDAVERLCRRGLRKESKEHQSQDEGADPVANVHRGNFQTVDYHEAYSLRKTSVGVTHTRLTMAVRTKNTLIGHLGWQTGKRLLTACLGEVRRQVLSSKKPKKRFIHAGQKYSPKEPQTGER
jgi:hypothetical protein